MPAPQAALGDLSSLKYLVVGCGFYGAVMAERIATSLGQKVLVLDVRKHIGGNSYSYTDAESLIEVHAYGSHIFHTSNEAVWNYLNRFTKFNSYRHTVYTKHQGQTFSMPINLHTINQYYRKSFGPGEAKAFLQAEIGKTFIENPANLEEKAISLIGQPLYEAFIKGYTQKQWGQAPTGLPAQIITRLPVRYNFNNRYFSDKWEGQPVGGYGALFRQMLAHENITIALGVDFFEIKNRIPEGCRIIYTGPIDRYFEYKFGVLGWRTTDFKTSRLDVADFQGTSVMNYADLDVPYTRIHEFRHYHPERAYAKDQTIICEEYARTAGRNDDPYYPVAAAADKKMFEIYRTQAKALPHVIFGGRLGNYVYIDMHQAVAMALNDFSTLLEPHP